MQIPSLRQHLSRGIKRSVPAAGLNVHVRLPIAEWELDHYGLGTGGLLVVCYM